LDDLLKALEDSPPAEFLKASFLAYPLVNAAHILAVGALVTTVLLMDLRLLGHFASVERGSFRRLMQRVAFTAFAAAAFTGLLLFSVRARDYAENPAFLAKLGLMVLAAANLGVFSLLERRRDAGVPRLPIFLSLAIWPLAIIAGRFIGFI
jgi:hypothetical protein